MIKSLVHSLIKRIRPVNLHHHKCMMSTESTYGRSFTIDVYGNNNTVSVGKDCLLTNTSVVIEGENNHLIIDNKVRFMGPCRIIMQGNSTLQIKEDAGIRGVAFYLKGADITIGEKCMFSYGITLRNHDSHRILSPENHEVLNPPKDIVLGRHVWVGQGATILKGCEIGEDSVIGFNSVVTKNCAPGSVMTGVPAKIVKENIIWDY